MKLLVLARVLFVSSLALFLFAACSAPSSPTPSVLLATANPPENVGNVPTLVAGAETFVAETPEPSATVVPPTATAVPVLPSSTPSPVPPTLTSSPTAVPPTETPTLTPSVTPSPTPTSTATPTLTATFTPSATATATNTPTPSATATRTRVPATATPKLSALAAAIRRSDATASHFEILGYYSNPYREVLIEQANGDRTTNAVHFRLKSLFAMLLGANPDSGADILRYKDQTYIHGPLPLIKLNEDRWYLIPAGNDAVAASGDPGSFLSPDFKEFTQVGEEAVDGVACRIYTIDKETARQRARDVLKVTAEQLGEIVNIEVTFWACDDGLVHRSRFRVDVKDRANPSTTDIVHYETRYFDYGAEIQITAPTDALPIPQ